MSEAQHKEFVVRLPAELHDALRRHADAEDLKMSQVIRRALRRYLNEAAQP